MRVKKKDCHGQQSVVPLAALAPQPPAHRTGLCPSVPGGEDNPPGAAVPARPAVPISRFP